MRSNSTQRRNRLAVLLSAVTGAVVAQSASANLRDVSWLGGSGNWLIPSNWTPAVVPHNTGTDTFHAFINVGSAMNPSDVTLDQARVLTALTLGLHDTLNIPGSLSLSTMANKGTVNVAGALSGADLMLGGGDGIIRLLNNNSQITLLGGTCTIGASQTVRGRGVIRALGNPSETALINLGVIDAVRNSLSESPLEIIPPGFDVTNQGIMQASQANGALVLGTGTYFNSGGIIQSIATGSDSPMVFLSPDSQIWNGTLSTAGAPGASMRLDRNVIHNAHVSAADGSLLRVEGSTLNGVTFATASGGTVRLLDVGSLTSSLNDITNNGMLQLGRPAAGTLSAVAADATLTGTFTNNGTLAFVAGTGVASPEIFTYSGTVTFAGTGRVSMMHGVTNEIVPAAAGDRLINGPEHTIEGPGIITGTLMNHGTLSARRVNSSSTTSLFGELDNAGTLQCQANSALDLTQLSPARNDGTVQTVGNGLIQVAGAWPGTGQWIADGGTIGFFLGSDITTTGPIVATNGGTIEITGGAQVTGSSSVSLTNGGKIFVDARLETTGPVSLLGNSHLKVNTGAVLGAAGGVLVGNTGSLELRGATVNAPTIITDGADARIVHVSGNSQVGNIDGTGETHVLGGTLTADRFRQNALHLSETAVVHPEGTTKATSRVNSLVFSSGSGALDLNDNDFVFDYTGGSPENEIRQRIAIGFAGGAWNGPGIRTAMGDASALGLGYAEATSLFSTFPAMFSGQPIDDTTIVIAFARFGDANLDGTTNIVDFSRLAANFNKSGPWDRGDFNYDGITNIADFSLLAANFNQSRSADQPRSTIAVPEASMFTICGAAMITVFRRARPGPAARRS